MQFASIIIKKVCHQAADIKKNKLCITQCNEIFNLTGDTADHFFLSKFLLFSPSNYQWQYTAGEIRNANSVMVVQLKKKIIEQVNRKLSVYLAKYYSTGLYV